MRRFAAAGAISPSSTRRRTKYDDTQAWKAFDHDPRSDGRRCGATIGIWICDFHTPGTHRSAWNGFIQPLLLQRYPGTSEIGLREAHAYAYGGCLIQDLGYYPFGKELFSDLTHYVRSGDFVLALLREAQDVNEFAFAIGALSHYVGDSVGHSEEVNPATALTFPDLAKRYGRLVTFEDDPIAHVRTEFGFDVAQTALSRYAPYEYRKQIGLRVSRAALERAYYETYGLTVRSILGPPRAAIGSYRVAVRRVIPLFAKATIR